MPNNDPYDFSDKYNTKLSDAEEFKFKNAMASYQLEKEAREKKNNPNYTDNRSLEEFIHDETRDYDMRGAFQKGIKQGKNFHWDDEFKKPNHITFSTDSKYNGVDGYKGGTWTKDDTGAYTFTPPKNSIYSDAEREKYWLEGDEASSGNHLNTAQGTRIITGANMGTKAGLADYASLPPEVIQQLEDRAPGSMRQAPEGLAGFLSDLRARADENIHTASSPSLALLGKAYRGLENYYNNNSALEMLGDAASVGAALAPGLGQILQGLRAAQGIGKVASAAKPALSKGVQKIITDSVREIAENEAINMAPENAQGFLSTLDAVNDSRKAGIGINAIRAGLR